MKKTKVIALCLCLGMLVTMTSASGYTLDLSEDGKVDVWDLQLAVNQGKGTEHETAILTDILGNPDELHPNAEGVYEIYTATGLYNMANMINTGKAGSKTFRLMQDVDLQGASWQTTKSFTGILEGNGHVISNLNIVGEFDLSASNDTDYGQGFFGKIGKGGAVRSLKLENATVVLTENSKASFVGLLAGSLTGEITDCTTVGQVIDPRTKLPVTTYIGTLAGRIENVSAYTVPGISVTDSSILMTAETAEVAAISGKSQKVLCKMGMDFGELSYGEGETKYSRKLGIAGWAPKYDSFSAYNWQDISGACTVEGGTGKVYDLEDPVLTARRQEAVDKMYEMCTVAWSPSKKMVIYSYKGSGGNLSYTYSTWWPETTYYGMPYSHGSGSLERMEAYSDLQNGVLEIKSSVPGEAYYFNHNGLRSAMNAYTDETFQTALDFTSSYENMKNPLDAYQLTDQPLTFGEKVLSADHAGFTRYIGNDCSQAIMWAWRQVVSSDVANGGTVISGVTQMTPTTDYQKRFGVLPVGGLVPSAYSVKAMCTMFDEKGADGFMNAYAQASRGDAIIVEQTAGGHSRMIAYDPIVIRDYRGNIDQDNSYLVTHEQGKERWFTDANGNETKSTCTVDYVYTFKTLLDQTDHEATTDGSKCNHYFPMTIPAFHDVNSKAVTSAVSYSGGVVKSNFYILSTSVDGNEVFTAITQHNGVNGTASDKNETIVGPGYREAQLTVDAAATHGTLTGKTITVRLSNGDVYTVNADTGAVTKQ